MKKSKHRKIVARRVEQATTEAVAEANAREADRLAIARRDRLEQQQSDDIALIEAGMIPVRVLADAMIPGSDVQERNYTNGGSIETTATFIYRGSQPAADAALRAIAKMSGERTGR